VQKILQADIRGTIRKLLLFGVLLWAWSGSCIAEEVSREKLKGLDEQVQDIKRDVLGISAELTQLEEKLIYPSNTQVSVFVSLEGGAKYRPDAVKIKIDGKDISSHIYTFKEVEALQSGGVQRLYTGNIRTGEHILDVSLISKSSGNAADQQSATYKFTKSVEPKLIEISLGGSNPGGQSIGFKD
jgi:hypothetical protein